MAKRKSNGKGKSKAKKTNGHAVVVVGANFRAKAKSYVNRIEECLGSLDTEKGKYMRACQPIKEDMTEIYSEAKAEGIDTKALKAEIRIRQLEKMKDAAREKLSPESQDELDKIRMALGELDGTPLGNAALAAQPSGGDHTLHPDS